MKKIKIFVVDKMTHGKQYNLIQCVPKYYQQKEQYIWMKLTPIQYKCQQ